MNLFVPEISVWEKVLRSVVIYVFMLLAFRFTGKRQVGQLTPFDLVVLGSDWPFVPWHPSPVAWAQGLTTVSREEKEPILGRNLESLLKL